MRHPEPPPNPYQVSNASAGTTGTSTDESSHHSVPQLQVLANNHSGSTSTAPLSLPGSKPCHRDPIQYPPPLGQTVPAINPLHYAHSFQPSTQAQIHPKPTDLIGHPGNLFHQQDLQNPSNEEEPHLPPVEAAHHPYTTAVPPPFAQTPPFAHHPWPLPTYLSPSQITNMHPFGPSQNMMPPAAAGYPPYPVVAAYNQGTPSPWDQAGLRPPPRPTGQAPVPHFVPPPTAQQMMFAGVPLPFATMIAPTPPQQLQQQLQARQLMMMTTTKRKKAKTKETKIAPAVEPPAASDGVRKAPSITKTAIKNARVATGVNDSHVEERPKKKGANISMHVMKTEERQKKKSIPKPRKRDSSPWTMEDYRNRKKTIYNQTSVTAEEVQKAIPKDASCFFHIMDRRINLDAFDDNASFYSLLRAWVQDDPHRYTPPVGANMLEYVTLPSQQRFGDEEEDEMKTDGNAKEVVVAESIESQERNANVRAEGKKLATMDILGKLKEDADNHKTKPNPRDLLVANFIVPNKRRRERKRRYKLRRKAAVKRLRSMGIDIISTSV